MEPLDEEPLGAAPEVLDEALLETGLIPDEVAMVAGLVRRAKDQGLALTGPGRVVEVVDQVSPPLHVAAVAGRISRSRIRRNRHTHRSQWVDRAARCT